MKRREILVVAALMVIIAAASFYAGNVIRPPQKQLKPVSYAASFILLGLYAPFYAGIEEGFYADEGIALTVQRGFGSVDTARRVALGSVNFGDAGMTTVAVARARDQNVRVISMMYHNSGFVIIYTEDSGIRTPKDLEGKRLISFSGSVGLTFWPAFAKANGIDPSKVQLVLTEAAAQASALFTGKGDASVNIFQGLYGTWEKLSKSTGKKFKLFYFSEYGLDVYGNGIIANDKLIETDPDLVARFVRATQKAHVWSYENPEKAIDHYLKHNPQVEREDARKDFLTAVVSYFDGIAEKAGLGYMDPEKVKRTVEIVNQYLAPPRRVTPDEVYTNKFVEPLRRELKFPNVPSDWRSLPVGK